MKIYHFFLFIFFGLIIGHAQVPVEPAPVDSIPPSPSGNTGNSFEDGIFSDPSEIIVIKHEEQWLFCSELHAQAFAC